MKKVLLLLIAVCCLWLNSCVAPMMAVPTIRDNNVNIVDMGGTVVTAPITADLNISDERARGEAVGMVDEADRLIREATMRALDMAPPVEKGPDVLVGRNVFKEATGTQLRVIVTGYPAWYENFRSVPHPIHSEEAGDSAWLIVTFQGDGGGSVADGGGGLWSGRFGFRSANQAESEAVGATMMPVPVTRVQPQGRRDFYLALRYLPVASPVYLGTFNAEIGMILRNGSFLGCDLITIGESDGWFIGSGFTYGMVRELGQNRELQYGGTVGSWVSTKKRDRYYYVIGPFARLRYNVFEVSSRMLIGSGVSIHLGAGLNLRTNRK